MAFEANAGSTEKNERERSRLRGRQWRGFEYRVIDDKKKLTFNTTYNSVPHIFSFHHFDTWLENKQNVT
jgi:hypothetical protein